MKLGRLLRTVFYMKAVQVFFQIRYRLKRPKYTAYQSTEAPSLTLLDGLSAKTSLRGSSSFQFLNKEYTFSEIDWNYSEYGKLWCYNLNYFDFLNQDGISKDNGIALITDYIGKTFELKDGHEPYPLSLRGINWIKFLSKHKIINQEINNRLYSQYKLLSKKLEYHLLGNHLLENGFAMLWAAFYFRDEKFKTIAKKILSKELEEQVLADGAHFELSPMYHCIILERLLDAYNLVKNNPGYMDNYKTIFINKAQKMLSWLSNMVVDDKYPLFNDSTEGISATSRELFDYAERLGIHWDPIELGESGYRRLKTKSFVLIGDLGKEGPTYIPGHAHADMLNFVLYYKEKPIIIDSGISTYEWGDIRAFERSSSAHNTVQFANWNQSEVWGSHRVGGRATIDIIKDEGNCFGASVVGYKGKGHNHQRLFSKQDDLIRIKDSILPGSEGTYRIHFAPEISPRLGNGFLVFDELRISFKGAKTMKIVEYQCGLGFNKRVSAACLEIVFHNNLETTIRVAN